MADLARQHEAMRHSPLAETHDITGALIALFPELRDLYARCLYAHNIGIALTWQERFDEAVTWLDRARALAREISPLAEASVLVVKADTLLEAGRLHDAEKVMLESDAIAGSLPSSIRDTDIIRAALESMIGNHAQALDRHGRALTRAELGGDQAAIQVIVVSLVRAFTRAGREREMLEAAGVAQAPRRRALCTRRVRLGGIRRAGPRRDQRDRAPRAARTVDLRRRARAGTRPPRETPLRADLCAMTERRTPPSRANGPRGSLPLHVKGSDRRAPQSAAPA